MKEKIKSYLSLAVKILISAVLVSYLLYSQDVGAIKNSLAKFNYIFLLLSLGLMFLGTAVSSLRWQEILRTSNYEVSLGFLYSLYIKGYLYNNFLPTQMGGDVYKALMLGRKIDDKSTALFSVFMDRFSGLIVLLVLGIVGISIIYGSTGLILALAVLTAGLFLYMPVLKTVDKFVGHKIKFINKFLTASDLMFKNKEKGILILAYSLLIQAISFASTYFIFMGLGVRLKLVDVLTYMPITSLSSLIPSFNGIGTQDTVYAVLFSNAGVTEEIAVTASIIMHITRLILSLFGGVLVLFGV